MSNDVLGRVFQCTGGLGLAFFLCLSLYLDACQPSYLNYTLPYTYYIYNDVHLYI